VGDEIDIAANGPMRRFTIAGLAGYGDVDSLAGATFAVWDVPTARSILDMDGYTGISVAAACGVSNDRLLEALRDVAGPATEVRSGEDQAAEDKKGIGTFIAFIWGSCSPSAASRSLSAGSSSSTRCRSPSRSGRATRRAEGRRRRTWASPRSAASRGAVVSCVVIRSLSYSV
jgi:hypothetical protein